MNFKSLPLKKPVKHWLQFNGPDAWDERHPEFSRRQSKPVYGKPIEKLLWCSNEYFTAGSVWRKTEGIWACVLAAPILHWMKGMNPADVKVELAKRGCEHKWLGGSSTN